MWEQYNQSGSISTSHWTWNRWEKGKFVEDESYEWSDAENERRLGIRVRETKYFIFFREIRYKQREHNYWIERAGGWRIKIPFSKHTSRQGLPTGLWLICPLLYYIRGLSFLALPFADATAERLKAIQNPQGKSRGR